MFHLTVVVLALLSVGVCAANNNNLKAISLIKKKSGLSKAVELRGGASLGPITPDIAFNLQAVATVLYAVELGATSSAAAKKYYGETSAATEQSLQYFGAMLALYTGILYYLKQNAGVCSQLLCRLCTFTWATFLVMVGYHRKFGQFITPQPMFVQGFFTALLAFIGYTN